MKYYNLMMINHVSWVLEWIVLINNFCINDQCPCPWWKIVLKIENMINEKKRKMNKSKNVKILILMNVQLFLMRPLRKISRTEEVKNWFWWISGFFHIFWFSIFFIVGSHQKNILNIHQNWSLLIFRFIHPFHLFSFIIFLVLITIFHHGQGHW